MKSKNRIISISFVLFIIIFMLLANNFIIKEKDHDCIGSGCKICEEIRLCNELINNIVISLSKTMIILLLLNRFLKIHILSGYDYIFNTLVDLKQKLSY